MLTLILKHVYCFSDWSHCCYRLDINWEIRLWHHFLEFWELCLQERPHSPSGLTPLTFLSQPHFSSSPRVHALVTAMAKAAEDRACTKAASRVPETRNICDVHNIRGDKLTSGCCWSVFHVSVPWFITLPNTLIPRGVVEQFQRRFLNWCWHLVTWRQRCHWHARRVTVNRSVKI